MIRHLDRIVFTILIFWVVFGAALMLTAYIPEWRPSPVIATIPPIIQFFTGLFIAAGSIIILSADHKWKNTNMRRALESAGQILSLGGWIAFTAEVFLIGPDHILGIITGMSMMIITVVYYRRSIGDRSWNSG